MDAYLPDKRPSIQQVNQALGDVLACGGGVLHLSPGALVEYDEPLIPQSGVTLDGHGAQLIPSAIMPYAIVGKSIANVGFRNLHWDMQVSRRAASSTIQGGSILSAYTNIEFHNCSFVDFGRTPVDPLEAEGIAILGTAVKNVNNSLYSATYTDLGDCDGLVVSECYFEDTRGKTSRPAARSAVAVFTEYDSQDIQDTGNLTRTLIVRCTAAYGFRHDGFVVEGPGCARTHMADNLAYRLQCFAPFDLDKGAGSAYMYRNRELECGPGGREWLQPERKELAWGSRSQGHMDTATPRTVYFEAGPHEWVEHFAGTERPYPGVDVNDKTAGIIVHGCRDVVVDNCDLSRRTRGVRVWEASYDTVVHKNTRGPGGARVYVDPSALAEGNYSYSEV